MWILLLPLCTRSFSHEAAANGEALVAVKACPCLAPAALAPPEAKSATATATPVPPRPPELAEPNPPPPPMGKPPMPAKPYKLGAMASMTTDHRTVGVSSVHRRGPRRRERGSACSREVDMLLLEGGSKRGIQSGAAGALRLCSTSPSTPRQRNNCWTTRMPTRLLHSPGQCWRRCTLARAVCHPGGGSLEVIPSPPHR